MVPRQTWVQSRLERDSWVNLSSLGVCMVPMSLGKVPRRQLNMRSRWHARGSLNRRARRTHSRHLARE